MSNYNISEIHSIQHPLDEVGIFFNLPRLENETLFNYKLRLLEHIKNRPNGTIESLIKTSNILLNLRREKICVIDTNLPLCKIDITAKYFRLIDDGEDLLSIDLYNSSIENVINQLLIVTPELTLTNINEDTYLYSAKHIGYGSNEYQLLNFNLMPSKVNNLTITHIKDFFLYSSKHTEEISNTSFTNDNQYYLNKEEGLLYTAVPAVGICSAVYYKNPFDLFYYPINFINLNDQDIKYIINNIITDIETEDYSILNPKGARWINELLSVHPINWGI